MLKRTMQIYNRTLQTSYVGHQHINRHVTRHVMLHVKPRRSPDNIHIMKMLSKIIQYPVLTYENIHYGNQETVRSSKYLLFQSLENYSTNVLQA